MKDAAAMHDDWGRIADRWSGVRSEVVDVHGTPVHMLRAADGRDGPVQLLVHGLGGSAANWLDVIVPLSAHGPVVAPDLPGFGWTEPPMPRAARVRTNARFLRALMRTLAVDRAVVHGNSMGGTVAVLFADLEPDLVERLVLVAPALPGSFRGVPTIDRMTLLRFGPFIVAPLGAAVLKRSYRRKSLEEFWEQNIAYVHADPSRVADELLALGLDNLRGFERSAWRLPSFVMAATSLVTSLLVRRNLLGVVDRITVPTMLVWGDRDRLVGRSVVDLLARRRADWRLEILEGVGHAPMMEVPADYARRVAAWLDTRPESDTPQHRVG